MQQSVQTDATCNFQQCSELLANNVTSVCTGLYVKPVAVSYFQIQNGVYCKFTISWNLNWVASAKSGGEWGKNPSSFFPPLVTIPTPATQAEALWKRTQHSWPSSPNIVGCYMLCPFAHPVACCSEVGSYCAKFETSQTFSYTQTDAITRNIAGPTVASLCT